MTERAFVLMPLTDVASGMIVGGRKVSEWLSDADVQGIEVADANREWWRKA
jgi:2-amino-4-hydroxy-6-hydroxymethyldihydropteridine diphosphokinase